MLPAQLESTSLLCTRGTALFSRDPAPPGATEFGRVLSLPADAQPPRQGARCVRPPEKLPRLHITASLYTGRMSGHTQLSTCRVHTPTRAIQQDTLIPAENVPMCACLII